MWRRYNFLQNDTKTYTLCLSKCLKFGFSKWCYYLSISIIKNLTKAFLYLEQGEFYFMVGVCQ